MRAQAGNGASAESVIEVPRDYQWEIWIGQPERMYAPATNVLFLAGVKQVAFVGNYYSYWDECSPAALDRVVSPQPAGGDSVARQLGIDRDTISVSRQKAFGRPCGDKYYTKKEVEVVASGAPWPFGEDYTTWRLNPTASNISNAFGFVGGVFIKRLPRERCEWDGYSSAEKYCKLRYDSTTATLSGSISSSCPLNPDSVRVALREIEPGPTEPLPRIRRPYLDRSGHYEIGAIRPGIRHELSITGGVGTWAWSSYTDTLTFRPGQRVTHSATLNWVLRLGSCQW
jgi:hypothetical protein